MADEASGESKPQPKQEGKVINLIIKDQHSGEVHFKIKSHTKFEKVFKAYCDKKSLDPKSVKFLFDGHRLKAEDTPEAIDLEDGDSVDCMVEQTGGCC